MVALRSAAQRLTTPRPHCKARSMAGGAAGGGGGTLGCWCHLGGCINPSDTCSINTFFASSRRWHRVALVHQHLAKHCQMLVKPLPSPLTCPESLDQAPRAAPRRLGHHRPPRELALRAGCLQVRPHTRQAQPPLHPLAVWLPGRHRRSQQQRLPPPQWRHRLVQGQRRRLAQAQRRRRRQPQPLLVQQEHHRWLQPQPVPPQLPAPQ